MKTQKYTFGLIGLITILLVMRIGEYGADYWHGDRDGHFSTAWLAFGIGAFYRLGILMLTILLVPRCHQWLRQCFPEYAAMPIAPVLVFAGQGVLIGVFAGKLLAFDPGWFAWLTALCAAGIAWGSRSDRQTRKRVLMNVILVLMLTLLTYTLIVAGNVLLHNYGGSLPFWDQTMRYQYYSFGIFRLDHHPRYRQQFHAFLPPAQKSSGVPGDIYAVYGLPLVSSVQLSWPDSDAVGWPNTTSLNQADALFIGDSFTRGNAAGFDHSIPIYYEKASGRKVYIASNEGYGLGQYLAIFRHLTQDLPEQTRFHGKQAYIVLCIENDLGLDLRRYQDAVKGARRTAAWSYRALFYLKLTPMRRLIEFVRMTRQQGVAQKREEFPLVTLQDERLIAQEKIRTQGWYPHFMMLPAYSGMPFAFFRGNLIDFADITWFEEDREDMLEILQDLQDSAQETGIHVRFVVLPTTLQIVSPYFESRPSDEALEFERLLPTILRNVNTVYDQALLDIQSVGFETLDIRSIFAQHIASERLVWPGDIHFTPEGYQLIGESIATQFHQ